MDAWRSTGVSLFLALTLTQAAGCLNVEVLDTRVEPWGAVFVRFQLRTSGGAPAPGLGLEDLTLSEDDVSISPTESLHWFAPREEQYWLPVLMLVDVSPSMPLVELEEALTDFAEAMPGDMEVAIYRFDGRDQLAAVLPFTSDGAAAVQAIDKLDVACVHDDCDPSTDLYGAVLHGLELLDDHVSDEQDATDRLIRPALVVFTDGQDWASRHARKDVVKAAKASDYDIYAVGLGEEADATFLEDIGRAGHAFISDPTGVQDAFAEIAASVVDVAHSYYALGYCSPARDGFHTLTLHACWGSFCGSDDVEFDADEFDEDRVGECLAEGEPTTKGRSGPATFQP